MKTDYQIQKDVIAQIGWEPFLKSSQIGVSVKNGIVTLSGNVGHYAQKFQAERAAWKVAGVKAIAEDIQIGVSPSLVKSDTEIADSVLNSLAWHSAVPEDLVRVKVENGIVTLEGEVEWEFQRNSAKNAVAHLIGVRNVINLLKVAPKVLVQDVKSRISEALHRSATVDSEKVSVDVDGSRVVLRGKVRSHAEMEDIEDAVWCAPGVTNVECYLEIEPHEEYTY